MEFEVTPDGILIATLRGPMALVDARARGLDAIRHAATHRLHRVLIDVEQAEGIEAPRIAARIEMAHEWVRCAPPGLAIAVVASETLLDGERIATILAQNMGLRAHATPCRQGAEAWLRAQAPIVVAAPAGAMVTRGAAGPDAVVAARGALLTPDPVALRGAVSPQAVAAPQESVELPAP